MSQRSSSASSGNACSSASRADTLRQNDLGTLELVLGDAILATTYLIDRALGSVLLIDPVEGDTVGAAMIIEL